MDNKFIFILLTAFVTLLIGAQQGQDSSIVPIQDTIIEKDSSTIQDTTSPPHKDSLLIQSILDSSAAIQDSTPNISKPKKYDYKYQVIGGVAMMLFFGLAIGITESMNPR